MAPGLGIGVTYDGGPMVRPGDLGGGHPAAWASA